MIAFEHSKLISTCAHRLNIVQYFNTSHSDCLANITRTLLARKCILVHAYRSI